MFGFGGGQLRRCDLMEIGRGNLARPVHSDSSVSPSPWRDGWSFTLPGGSSGGWGHFLGEGSLPSSEVTGKKVRE
jgi:hypothetical protein